SARVWAQPHQVSHSGFGAYEASLAAFGDGFAVTWYDTRDGHGEIYARILDAAGTPAGPELRLTRGGWAAHEADVAGANQPLIVAWYEVGPNSRHRAMLGSWTQDGRLLWKRQLQPDGRDAKNPVVRISGTEVFCAWLDERDRDPAVYAQWFDLSGQPRG